MGKAAPALLPVATSAPVAGASTFQRPSAFDAVPPPAYVPPEREQMRQIAEMCAKQGTQSLDELRSSPENRFKMPFIYDGNPGYEEFKNMIIEYARVLAQQTAAAAAMGTMPHRPGVPLMTMPALRPPLVAAPPNVHAASFNTMPQIQPRPGLQPPSVGGFPRPMMMAGPRPIGMPNNPNQPPPSFPGQQPPRRSRFG
jgi:hypothetical protein